jgi:hypothetical protein
LQHKPVPVGVTLTTMLCEPLLQADAVVRLPQGPF